MVHCRLSIEFFEIASVLLFLEYVIRSVLVLKRYFYSCSDDSTDRFPTLQHGFGHGAGHAGRVPQAGGQGIGGAIGGTTGGIMGGC